MRYRFLRAVGFLCRSALWMRDVLLYTWRRRCVLGSDWPEGAGELSVTEALAEDLGLFQITGL